MCLIHLIPAFLAWRKCILKRLTQKLALEEDRQEDYRCVVLGTSLHEGEFKNEKELGIKDSESNSK